MTKTKFIFNINGKRVEKEPKEALAIYKKDKKDIKAICDNTAKDLMAGIELLKLLDSLIEKATQAIKGTPAKKRGRPAKKTAVVSKNGGKPSKIEKPVAKKRGRPAKVVAPAPKKRGRPAKVNPVKKIKRAIKARKAK